MLFESFHFYILIYKKQIVLKYSRHTNTCPKESPPAIALKYYKPLPSHTMNNLTKNIYNPGLVFRVLQYLNSDINIYPTAIIILKFWVVLEQTFCKKGSKLTLRPNPLTISQNGFLALRQYLFTP